MRGSNEYYRTQPRLELLRRDGTGGLTSSLLPLHGKEPEGLPQGSISALRLRTSASRLERALYCSFGSLVRFDVRFLNRMPLKSLARTGDAFLLLKQAVL